MSCSNWLLGMTALLPQSRLQGALGYAGGPGTEPGGARGRNLRRSQSQEADPRSWLRRRANSVLRWRVPLLIGLHALLFSVLYPLAYFLRFGGEVPPTEIPVILATLPVVAGVKLAAFLALKTHRGWWRYATFADMVNLAGASTVAAVGVVLIRFFCRSTVPIPRSVILLDWAATLVAVGGLRASTRLIREYCYPMIGSRPSRPVLIVGASEAGLALIRELRALPRLGLKVVGLLDPDDGLRGQILGGVPVLGRPEEVRRLAARWGVERVLVPTPALAPAVVRKLVAACNSMNVKVQVVPGFDALLSGRLVVQPRDVEIEDLLARDPVQLDGRAIGRFLTDRVVLITGAAGSIGSELCRQVLGFRPSQLVLLDHSENGLFYLERELQAWGAGTQLIPCMASITDAARLRVVLRRYQPAVVLHAAAHKHVPMMEANPGEAIKNNVFGTRKLVDEAIRAGVETFVMISTDKAVHPTSVMGTCKRLAEMYVQARSEEATTRLITVRFGNVLGSNGSVVPLFKEQIRRGGPITVTHPEMTRYFMTIPEAAQLVLQAGAFGRGGEIFVLDMGQPVRILDLAQDLIRLSGLSRENIEITFTGLRPGEKLYEELYDDHEERIGTPHPKIFAARHRPSNPDLLRTQLARLAGVVDCPADEVIAALQEVMSEYHPVRPTIAREDRPIASTAGRYRETADWDRLPTSDPGLSAVSLSST